MTSDLRYERGGSWTKRARIIGGMITNTNQIVGCAVHAPQADPDGSNNGFIYTSDRSDPY